MKLKLISTLFLNCFFISICSALPLQVHQGPLDSGQLFVDCEFDSIKDLCQVDTGANFTSIANKPEYDNYKSIGKFRFKSASGIPKEVNKVTINEIAFGDLKLSSVNVARLGNDPQFNSVAGLDLLLTTPFSFNFSSSPELNFELSSKLSLKGKLITSGKDGLTMPISIASNPIVAFFDTGAGLSCVDTEYISKYPELFSFVMDIPNGVDATGNTVFMKLYKIKHITIGTHEFYEENVLAFNFEPIREKMSKDVSFIIGFNLITKANWYFDIKNALWDIE